MEPLCKRIRSKVKINIKVAQYDLSKDITPQINVKNIPDGYVVTGYDPKQVTATITGAKSILDKIALTDISMEIDFGNRKLTQAKETLVVDINMSNFKLPEGTNLVSFAPSSIKVVLEKKY
jgi:YbbR domain-containing protein